jgi:hypothetical protein
VPFVQGQLRGERLSVAVTTECEHCSQPMHIEMDSEGGFRVQEEGADPLTFVPMVDHSKLTDPCITDAF